MKTLFLGTPSLAVPFLDALAKKTQIVSVITSPDQPAGRGYQVKAPPVKQAAQRLGLAFEQPEALKDASWLEAVQKLTPDVGIVVAYGKLLPRKLLDIPKYGFLNVHFSLLPAYRGAAPIQWALINGERETGVTLFWLDEGMDTGPIFIQKKIEVGDQDAESLRSSLVSLGVQGLNEALAGIEKGEIRKEPQIGPGSRAPMLKKDDGEIHWQLSADRIVNLLRGTTPWPGAFTRYKVQGNPARLKVIEAQAFSETGSGGPGTIWRVAGEEGIIVKCGQNSLKLTQVQPEGKKAMPAWNFWQGARLHVGDQFESV